MDLAFRGARDVRAHFPVSHMVRPQDVRYLKPHVVEVSKEDQERFKWDNMEVERRR